MQSVKVVGLTAPMVEGVVSAEELVAYCARVSNPSNQLNGQTADKLLQYCVRNAHWSVFEMVNVVMEVNTTRDIARQILRHRSFSFQEFSQRYADATQLEWMGREARLQDQKNRQNSVELHDQELKDEWNWKQAELMAVARHTYKWALEKGIAKEVARAVLPEGMMMSRMYVNGTLRSWIHYCDVRRGNGTQKEHREVAEMCWREICKVFAFLAGRGA